MQALGSGTIGLAGRSLSLRYGGLVGRIDGSFCGPRPGVSSGGVVAVGRACRSWAAGGVHRGSWDRQDSAGGGNRLAAVDHGAVVVWARSTDPGSSPPYGLWRLVVDELVSRAPETWSELRGLLERPTSADGLESGSSQRFALFAMLRTALRRFADPPDWFSSWTISNGPTKRRGSCWRMWPGICGGPGS